MSSHAKTPWNPSHEGLEVATLAPADKQVVVPSDKVALPPSQSDKEAVAVHGNSSRQQQKFLPRGRWVIVGVVLLIVVLAAVLGGVLGSRHGKKSATSTTSPPSSTSSTTSSPSSSVTPFHYSGNIAAISTTWAGGGTRLYYQAATNELVEAATTDNKTWTNTKLGIFPRSGTALAAAVSRPLYSSALEITVLYTSTDGVLHDLIYTQSGGWANGSLSGQSYVIAANSRLAALYYQCTTCADTVAIAFQASDGSLQFGNRTSTGWQQLTQLNFDQINGTGLALQGPEAYGGLLNQINLYHQKVSGLLALASWVGDTTSVRAAGWFPADQTYDSVPPGTPISAVSSNDYVYDSDDTAFTAWILMLSLSSLGIVVDYWSGNINNWVYHGQQSEAISNSTGPLRTFSSPAVTSQGFGFAVVSSGGQNDTIQSWVIESDFSTWNSTGAVDIGASWG